jgi:dipeptidyl aminopeptidase/acylaminoacyl peptidase
VCDLPRAVSELAVSPDGRRIALITAPENNTSSFEGKSDVQILNLADGSVSTLPDDLWRKEAPTASGELDSLAWARDGRCLAFRLTFNGYPSEIILARWQQDGVITSKLPIPEAISVYEGPDVTQPLCWISGSSTIGFLGAEKARARLYSATGLDGPGPVRFECLTPGDVVVKAFSSDRAGARAAVIISGPQRFPDIGLVQPDGEVQQLTHVNPQVDAWKIPRVSVVSWKGQGDSPVEGILELPAESQSGKPLPLIVHLHGGPTRVWPYSLYYSYFGTVLFSSAGYAVFSPNYRGSISYGEKFVTDLIGHMNDIEVEDIISGVEHLVSLQIADRERIGVTGWSNGGYLTNFLITRSDRIKLKAASVGAGIADLVLEWGTSDEPDFASALLSGLPWNRPDEYRRTSPIFRFDMVNTPTIFHVGANDVICPPGNTWMLYRALTDHTTVPTELIVYPNQPHGLASYSSRRTKMMWDLAWFDRYIRGKQVEK